MFLVNSRSHLVTCNPHQLRKQVHHQQRRTFSRSYGTNLPSSFTRVFSSALGFSPTHLCWFTVRFTCYLKLRGFSWKHGINHFPHYKTGRHRISDIKARICLSPLPTYLNRDNQHPVSLSLLRHPIAVTQSTGILTCFPSTTPFGLALGADSPCADYVAQETLGFRRAGFSPALSLLMSAFALLIPPACLTAHFLHRLTERSSTMHSEKIYASAASVHSLSPVKSSAQAD